MIAGSEPGEVALGGVERAQATTKLPFGATATAGAMSSGFTAAAGSSTLTITAAPLAAPVAL
jgi:hypothetical protein